MKDLENRIRKIIKRDFPLIDTILDNYGVVLAGGALRDLINGDTPKDWDFFFLNEGAFHKSLQHLRNIAEHNDSLYDLSSFIISNHYTKTLETNGVKIQLIHKKFYDSVDDVVDSFDFNVCQVALTTEVFYITPEIHDSITRKEVEVNVLPNPVDSLNRLLRLRKKGYIVKKAYWQIVSKLYHDRNDIDSTFPEDFYTTLHGDNNVQKI